MLFTQEEIERTRQMFCVSLMDKREYRPLEFYKGKKILLWTRKPGLGDMVMNVICCDILRNKYGLNVWFGCRQNPCDRDFPKIMKGVPSYNYSPDLHKFPIADNTYPRGFSGGVDHQGEKHPFDFIIDFRYNIHSPQNTIFQCLKEFGITKIETPLDGFRVKDEILRKPNKIYDVVLCCSTGGWKPIRAYRKNKELKVALEHMGYSVLDLSVHGKGIKHKYGVKELLQYVKWSKYYIGVETGPTHLVSGVHNKAIIIQSGIHLSSFWNAYRETSVLELKLQCGGRQCKARTHEQCPLSEGACIDRINVSDILKLVK